MCELSEVVASQAFTESWSSTSNQATVLEFDIEPGMAELTPQAVCKTHGSFRGLPVEIAAHTPTLKVNGSKASVTVAGCVSSVSVLDAEGEVHLLHIFHDGFYKVPQKFSKYF